MRPIGRADCRVLIAAGAMVLVAGMTPAHAANKAPPDLTGVWAEPWSGDRFGAEAPIDKSLIPPKAPPPAFTPEYEAKAKAIGETLAAVTAPDGTGAGATNADSQLVQRATNCLPYGMPRMMGAGYSMEILQKPKHLTIIGEAMFEVRRIYLDQKQLPLEEVDMGYAGHSVGHWEGDTLVVNTIGVKESVLGEGNLPHSDKMVITERIRLRTPDVLQNQVTLTDPIALVRPHTYTITLARLKNYETPEYVCDNPREKIDANGKLRVDVASE